MALALVLFCVYAAGACRTIYVGDSGELTAAVGMLGIPHPSGYPLYVLLGRLWVELLRFGSVAWRMSLFSCLWGALACGLLYLVCRRMRLSRASALLGALGLAFAPSFWAEANVQRVYTLNAFFVVAATGLAWRWLERRDERSWIWPWLAVGLGAANHTYMLVYGVALGLFAGVADARWTLRPRRLAIAGAALGAGLLPYLYLPLRSRMNPPLDWGNPETWQGFWDVVLRRGFWERAWLEGPLDLIPITLDYLKGLGHELGWLGLPLAAGGFACMARKHWRFAALALLAMAGNLGSMALHGSRSDLFIWHRYYIPSYALACLGLAWSAEEIRKRWPGRSGWLLLLPALMLLRGWAPNDRSGYRIADDFARRVLKSVPPGGVLSATDDNILFALIYLHFVENRRPDMHLVMQGVGGADLPALHFDPENEPLLFTHHPNWSLPQLDITPVGVVFRVWKSDSPPPPTTIEGLELAGETDPGVPKDYLTQNLIGHFHSMLGQTFERQGDWPQAQRQYELASASAPDNDVQFYNLGLIYQRRGLLQEALAAFRRSHEINPRAIASNSKVRAQDKIQEIEGQLHR